MQKHVIQHINGPHIASASSFLRREFSFSDDLSRFTSGTSMPPNFLRQMQKVAFEIA